ncbi:hypothetical protein ACIPSJ_11230 [Streptomyces sp. NPDC090088]|uniref:hypothetical protein n=1 Tax=Streptomyces sp. NPDC090088 TaxID=3365944 RepID=UPI0038096789
MADEQDKWLNRATAERLLRGESLEAVDASARDQAERLARRLGSLSVPAVPADTELPGEEAALAAFRKARESAEDERTALARQPGRTGRSADAGLFRIGAGTGPLRAPGWARPARFALAAALTVGMLGGVAAAVGTGVLPTPFGDDRPAPGASVSAAGTPAQPQGSTSPESLLGGESGTPSSGTTSGGSGTSSPAPSGKPRGRDTDSAGTPGGRWSGALTSCRTILNGKPLGADRKRALEGLAGGADRVNRFCRTVLGSSASAGKDGTTGDGKGGSGGQGNGQGNGNGLGGDDGQGGDGDGRPGHTGGNGGGDGDGNGGGNDHHEDGAASPAPTGFAPLLPNQPVATPSPTYSAL